MATATNIVYQFGKFQLDPVKGWLSRDGVVLDLPKKTLAVLTVLVSNAGHVVETKELMAKAWPGEPADEYRLDMQLSALRTLLKDADGRFLVTIPGKGVRFVQPTDELVVDRTPERKAETSAVEPEVALPKPQSGKKLAFVGIAIITLVAVGLSAWKFAGHTAATGGSSDDSASSLSGDSSSDSRIAVLPVRSGGGTADQSANDTLTAAVIERLSKASGISILPMKAVSKYNGLALDPASAATELGASAAVTIFIQKFGNRGRVTVQMVRASTGKEAWSEAFDTDFNGLADRITAEISKHASQAP